MDESRLPRARRPARRRFGLTFALAAMAGCAPQWHLSFGDAEQQQRDDRAAGRTERAMLLFYKDHLDPNSGRMEQVIESPPIEPLLNNKIRCLLLRDFPPNQRYMAQFDISTPPALVLVHPDGTYHAREGVLSIEETLEFLTRSTPPGRQPKRDISPVSVAEYAWISMYEDAEQVAARQSRKLFILYKWWLSPESTELINRLSSVRVRQQVGDMVHCILDWDYVPNRAYVARFGVTKVPALIIVNQDGSYHAQVGLATVDQIVQFISSARAPGRPPAPN